MMTVIDYGLGNLGSVANTLGVLGIPYAISSSPDDVRRASMLILPGVGAAGAGMENLNASGLAAAIADSVRKGVPLLGICLGMQLLFDYSEEGNVRGLGLIPGRVRRFAPGVRIPQIGWNQVSYPRPNNGSYLWERIPDGSDFYFVNGFYCRPDDPSVIAGVTDYNGPFASAVATEKLAGTQFHPEKSGDNGRNVLINFYGRFI